MEGATVSRRGVGRTRENFRALEEEMRKAAKECYSEQPTAPIPEKPSGR
jgi:hypothetical protein